jgi:DNA-binding NarL/FixJ family response regulator
MVVKQCESQNLGVLMLAFNPVVREGLQAIMSKDDGIEVMGDALDGNEAILHIKRAHGRGRPVNVVLTETRNGVLDGVQATRLIKDEFPEVAVLVLTENLNDAYVIDAIHAGAGGYIFLKDMSPEVLLQSIHRVVEGGMQMKTELLHTAVENLIQNGRKTLAERTAETRTRSSPQLWVSPWTLPKNTSETSLTRCRRAAAPMRLLLRPRQVSWAILSLLFLKTNLRRSQLPEGHVISELSGAK